MSKFRKLAAGAAALAAASIALPAGAQQVPVTLENPAGSRVMYVEDMLGQELTSLDFGSQQRTLPFRVRVVDSDFGRSDFTVNASMSNLYLNNGGTIGDYSKKIASDQITLGSQLNPVNALDVVATVQPVIDAVTTLTGADAALCTLLGLNPLGSLPGGGTGCQIVVNDVVGNVQDVVVSGLPLGDLPLVPQGPEAGNFPNAEYAVGVGAGDSSGGGAAGSQRKLIGGDAIETAALLNALTANVDTANLIDNDDLAAALATVNGLVGTALNPTQLNTVLSNTVKTVNTLTGTNILAQAGTYVSLPTLSVNVPAGADPGDYMGTLVVTGLQ